MSFAHALQRFNLGDITRQELNWEVDRLLAENPADLVDMLAEMERLSNELQIAPEIIEPIRARIAANTGYPLSAPAEDKTRLTSGNLSYPPRSDYSSSEVPGVQRGPPADRSLQVGDVLGGRFRLEMLLGHGGMSQVYLAEDLEAYGNPRVAVKVLSEAFATHPDALVSLKRETAKTQQLAHPNIINVRDFGTDGPYIYMHMEYLEGGSLYDELKHSHGDGLPPDDAMSILEGVCKALDYAHHHKIVHADLKPGNFMLTKRPSDGAVQAKIIDFGISRPARLLDSDEAEATIYDPGKLQALTLAYASPEMQAGEDPDPRDDIYALGCITYELFTGKHPFDRIAAEYAKARNLAVVKHPALNRQQLRAVRKAVSFERETRTATAGEFLEEFKSIAGSGITLPWKPIGIGALAIAAIAAIASIVIQSDIFRADPFAPGLTFQDCAECPRMTVIGAGTFQQGNAGGREAGLVNEHPVRTVTFTAPFAISTTEVTVAEFREFALEQGFGAGDCMSYGENGWRAGRGHSWTDPGFTQTPQHPVTCVSWEDASEYAAWLSQRTGFVYRLPSASEWEVSSAAGSSPANWWADEGKSACSAANVADQSAAEAYPAWITATCSDASVNTSPAGSYDANPFGIHDSLGNVFEWVLDCWNPNYVSAPVDGSAWLRGDCTQRELRGGSWFTQPEFVSHTFRNRLPADTRTSSIGFRVVRELERVDE